jgi:hypothetical protein
MVAWFIIAIATLAVFAFIAVNGVQTVAATTDGVGRIETARRMDAAVSAILARSGSPNNTGRMMIMAGTVVDNIHGLPPELAMYATTPFGQRMVYCPFGDGEGGTNRAVPVSATGVTTYPITVAADALRLYVTGGRPNLPQVAENPNLMGYLMAPRTKTSPTPYCSSVRFNTGTRRFEAPDAFVRPIIRSSSGEEQRQQAGREVVYYVSPNGTGRGLAPNDPTSIYAAVTYYRANLPQAMRIVLAPGNHMLPAQYLNATTGGFADKGNAGTLVLEGQTGAQLDFSGPGVSDIWVPGNLEIRNLVISTSVGVWAEQGHKLTLNNTSTGYVKINNGGILQAKDITVTNSRSDPWTMYVNDGSQATLTGAVNINATNSQHGMAAAGGSRVVFEVATITMTSINGGSLGYGFYNEENADLVFKSSTFSIRAPIAFPVLVFGNNTWYNSYITSEVSNARMFEIQRGGRLTLEGGMFGQNVPPGIGIIDVGSSGVSGTTRIRASSACWSNAGSANGVQFNMSGGANVNNSSSAVGGDEGVTPMNPNPTAAQVQANADAMARNTIRAQLRNTNTSNYTCQIG